MLLYLHLHIFTTISIHLSIQGSRTQILIVNLKTDSLTPTLPVPPFAIECVTNFEKVQTPSPLEANSYTEHGWSRIEPLSSSCFRASGVALLLLSVVGYQICTGPLRWGESCTKYWGLWLEGAHAGVQPGEGKRQLTGGHVAWAFLPGHCFSPPTLFSLSHYYQAGPCHHLILFTGVHCGCLVAP